MYELFGMKQILLNYVFMQNYDFNFVFRQNCVQIKFI